MAIFLEKNLLLKTFPQLSNALLINNTWQMNFLQRFRISQDIFLHNSIQEALHAHHHVPDSSDTFNKEGFLTWGSVNFFFLKYSDNYFNVQDDLKKKPLVLFLATKA